MQTSNLYNLQSPIGAPELPDCWSWSALRKWRMCPRQWWLLRARYSNASTPYPQPLYPATLEGILLHHAVEAFGKHAARVAVDGTKTSGKIRSSFRVRNVIQQKLREVVNDESNPRLDAARLLSRVSVDDCVNDFRAVASSYLEDTGSASSARKVKGPHTAYLPTGSEVQAHVADPPLCGRFDYRTSDEIVEFKTGAPDESHHGQLLFYSMLAWLLTNRIPVSLSIFYVRQNVRVSVTPPNADELKRMVDQYREEIVEIESQIAGGPPRANPSEENCTMCPVRQLCEPYWSAEETMTLRLTEKVRPRNADVSRMWLDVELDELPTMNQLGGFAGPGVARGIGKVNVRIGPSFVPRQVTGVPTVRLLNAVVESPTDECLVGTSTVTEAFWMA